jgi:hypothetical protein
LVTDLIVGLRERGLATTRPILVVIDGSKTLRRRCSMGSTARLVFDPPGERVDSRSGRAY